MERKTIVEIDGKSYEADYATISDAFIGFEDHGIFTAYLSFRGQSWAQGESARSWSGPKLKLYLQTVLKTLGADGWSKVTGQEVLVLRESYFGPILGFAHRTEDRYMLFEAIAEDPAVGSNTAQLSEVSL